MFDFKKLIVYQKAKAFANDTADLIAINSFDRITNDQFKRASLSIMLNIAEGSSRYSNKDRKNFLIISRGSAFECAAILDFLLERKLIDIEKHDAMLLQLEEISRILFSLIKKLETS
jgi:four helix bundle protein